MHIVYLHDGDMLFALWYRAALDKRRNMEADILELDLNRIKNNRASSPGQTP
jgi:hypothetical protein